MSTVVSSLLNLGIKEGLDQNSQAKIRTINGLLSLQIFLVATPFVFISWAYTPSLTWVPVLGVVFSILLLILMKVGWYSISRFFTGFLGLLLSAIYAAYLTDGVDTSNFKLRLLMLVFSLLPFLLYSLKERSTLFFLILLNIALFVGLPWYASYFNSTYDLSFLNEGFTGFLATLIPILLGMSIVYFLSWISQNSEIRSNDLVRQLEAQSEEVKASQREMEENLQQLKLAQKEEQDRNWITEGLGRVNTILRNSASVAETCEKVLQEMIKYTGANQGVIYLTQEEEGQKPYLQLMSAYAYGRKKHIQGRREIGQGLVGQAYLEKDLIFLTEIPDNYVKITSGLGGSNPRNIVVLPLIYNEKVEGVLEIASFQKLNERAVEYLQKLSENLASAFGVTKINERTRYLLELSTEQQEQMRSQAEELQQNMEELQATQEEMQRKNKEMEKLVAEMEVKNRDMQDKNEQLAQQEEELRQNMEEISAQSDELEEQLHKMKELSDALKVREDVLNVSTIMSEADAFGTILFANDKLCEVSKYSREEMIGKGHNLFRHPDMPKALFKLMWETIKAGKIFKGIVKNKAKDGSVYWVDATIAPVLDEEGKPYKYIGVRYVIERHDVAQQLFDEQMIRLGFNK